MYILRVCQNLPRGCADTPKIACTPHTPLAGAQLSQLIADQNFALLQKRLPRSEFWNQPSSKWGFRLLIPKTQGCSRKFFKDPGTSLAANGDSDFRFPGPRAVPGNFPRQFEFFKKALPFRNAWGGVFGPSYFGPGDVIGGVLVESRW